MTPPTKPCDVCKKELKPYEQYGFPETVCWTCFQEIETEISEMDRSQPGDNPSRAMIVAQLRQELDNG
jgi:predicted amidophosphoribosyltransferase